MFTSRPAPPPLDPPDRGSSPGRGFALVAGLSLMVLITMIAVGLLGLATIELRRSSQQDARATALANARVALALAIGQLQETLGDDRRISADASLFADTRNPQAVGAWTGWSPDLVSKTQITSASRVDYKGPKAQAGFRGWLVSSPDPQSPDSLTWHATAPPADDTWAKLFSTDSSGFDHGGLKVPVELPGRRGSVAWAVVQENTKARINIGVDDAKRVDPDDRLQGASRPSLANSAVFQQPSDDWTRRSAGVCSLPQAALDAGYATNSAAVAAARRDFTTESLSLLTHPVKGGLKVDLSTGFEMSDTEFATSVWKDEPGSQPNPFRSDLFRNYKGQRPLYRPIQNSAELMVAMNFPPASVNHKFQANGVPTFDTLRAHYRAYRHLYLGTGGAPTAFERPYSHIATPQTVAGRPFGVKTHPSIAPVLDRVNFIFSIYAKADGTLCILITPFVTIWNPHNVDVETEGLVVYPWIDLAVFWNWNVSSRSGSSPPPLYTSLSRFVGEGYQGHGRSTRPYYYLHLTQSGKAVRAGARVIDPAIRLAPGEVRVFCLADGVRRDLEFMSGATARTWRMKPVSGPSDITQSLKGGIVLNMTKSIGGTSNFNYRLKPGDVVNANRVEFDRGTYYYIVNMADAWQIKNPSVELMAEARPASGALPQLPAEKNLVYHGQIHSGAAFGKGNDAFSYPSFQFEQINENPKIVGSLLTYHRAAQSGTLPLCDLMFTTNPRQPHVTQYLGAGGRFQSGPHYESLMQGGTSLAQLAMETTLDGANAFYGPSHSSSSGRSHLAFFEIPRAPLLSLGALQHCDITATAFGCASQIGNSWASPYLSSGVVSKSVNSAGGGEVISPALSVYDASYLANEALFDEFYFSGAVPRTGSPKAATAAPALWDTAQTAEEKPLGDVLADFFANPRSAPLRQPRLLPYTAGLSPDQLKSRLAGPAACARLAGHLMFEGGFNVNSTSEEAWTALLSSLRGAAPASASRTPHPRFRHILAAAPVSMKENDPWSGFRSLSDADIKLLASQIVKEVRLRGPFLSLGEFVNRRVSTDRGLYLAGALQSAIDKSNLNRQPGYATFATGAYPNPENITNPSTGTNTPGWLTQADLLQALAPELTVRSDTFIVRAMGEARSADGKPLASVCLEAVVQRVPEWLDPVDAPSVAVAELKSAANRDFGRRFVVTSIRELPIRSL
jgi:hypothetical protein